MELSAKPTDLLNKDRAAICWIDKQNMMKALNPLPIQIIGNDEFTQESRRFSM